MSGLARSSNLLPCGWSDRSPNNTSSGPLARIRSPRPLNVTVRQQGQGHEALICERPEHEPSHLPS